MRGLLFFLPRTARYGPHLEKPDRLGQIVAVLRIVVDGFIIRVYTDDHVPLTFMSSVLSESPRCGRWRARGYGRGSGRHDCVAQTRYRFFGRRNVAGVSRDRDPSSLRASRRESDLASQNSCGSCERREWWWPAKNCPRVVSLGACHRTSRVASKGKASSRSHPKTRSTASVFRRRSGRNE